MEGMTIKHLTQDLSNPVLKDDERRKQLSRVVDYLTVSKVSRYYKLVTIDEISREI